MTATVHADHTWMIECELFLDINCLLCVCVRLINSCIVLTLEKENIVHSLRNSLVVFYRENTDALSKS